MFVTCWPHAGPTLEGLTSRLGVDVREPLPDGLDDVVDLVLAQRRRLHPQVLAGAPADRLDDRVLELEVLEQVTGLLDGRALGRPLEGGPALELDTEVEAAEQHAAEADERQRRWRCT